MPFASLIGNERIKKLLRRAVAEGRIGQGLIMAGPDGVGKREFSLALAQALNCARTADGDACGTCLPCRKIAAAEHPDVSTISPEGQFIKVDRVREMSREVYFRPFEGRRRVFILDSAERLHPSASGALLKTLEEPPVTSVLVLVTAKPYALLETIRSRCQMLNFAPLTEFELEAQLAKASKRSTEETHLLARLARGSIGHALEIDLEKYRERRLAMIELLETMALTQDTIRLLGAAEYLGKKIERDEFVEHLDAMMVLLGDLLRLKSGGTIESLTNRDIGDSMVRLAECATFEQITGWADRVERILRDLARNIGRQLAMEAMLFQERARGSAPP
ncbi:MAG TPA: DNA polymerase III subunit delta' [Blastocatellia bacterium]|nr:DNA polymerase III subunit delta' [Blastocatellia bacterium]